MVKLVLKGFERSICFLKNAEPLLVAKKFWLKCGANKTPPQVTSETLSPFEMKKPVAGWPGEKLTVRIEIVNKVHVFKDLFIHGTYRH
jgi:hypothetical protein